MATEQNLQIVSAPAAADLSGHQFCAVTVKDTVALSAAAKNSDGILQNKPTSGQAAAVATFGISKALLGDTVSAVGTLLEVETTTARLIPVSSGTAVAKALETGADGNLISVLILKSNAVYA